jgi:hypothetical protein
MCTSGVMESMSFSVSAGVSTGPSMGVMLPLRRRRGLADLQVQVGGVLLHHQFQQVVHLVAHGASLILWCGIEAKLTAEAEQKLGVGLGLLEALDEHLHRLDRGRPCMARRRP